MNIKKTIVCLFVSLYVARCGDGKDLSVGVSMALFKR